MHLIDINDWELSCFAQSGAQIYRAPCAASFQGELTLGMEALARAKTLPQAFAFNYLSRLNNELLPNALGSFKTQADLCFKQLEALREATDVSAAALLVPPQMSDQQLALLAGVASAAGIKPLGFIDHSLAYALAAQVATPTFVLDLGLHQTFHSKVAVNGSELTVTASTEYGFGLISLVDQWVNTLADEFMQSSRFDPLHSAQTEQQTFDAVMGWIADGTLPAELKLSIESQGTQRTAAIVPEHLQTRLDAKLDELHFDSSDPVIISHRLAQVPLLFERLSSKVSGLQVAEKASVVLAALSIATELDLENLERVRGHTSNRSNQPAATPQAVVTAPDSAAPERAAAATHLVQQATAYPITHPQFSAFLDEDGLLRPGVAIEVDGQPPTKARLFIGQTLTFQGQQWLAIRVA